MSRGPSRRLRGLRGSYLLVGSLAVASCRVGYDEIGAADSGSSAAANAAGGGVESSHGGRGGAAAGEDSIGGTSDSPLGGAAAKGGEAPAAGDSSMAGTWGDAGSTGAGGAGPTPSTCVASTDCSCASHGGHEYWFCTGALAWAGAEALCESQSMQLVRIDSLQENDFLVSQGASSGVFGLNGFAQIGANDRAVAGEWRWVDGELFWQGGPMGAAVAGAFSNWLASSPSASGVQQCSGLLDTGKWQVRSCTAVVPFICESP